MLGLLLLSCPSSISWVEAKPFPGSGREGEIPPRDGSAAPQDAGPWSCWSSELWLCSCSSLCSPSCSSGEGGGFSSPPFVEQLTLNHCLFPHQECFPTSWCSTQALLIDGSPFPQHVLSAESLLLFRFHPEEKLPQPSSSVSCEPSSAPQDNAAHHIGFLCYIRRHLPASSLKKHFSIPFSLVS